MTYIDSILLDATEWLCHKLQLLTGRTNVWVAVQLTNLSIIVYFVWAGVLFWIGDLVPRIFVGVFCSGVLYALTQTIFKVPIEEYERNAYGRVAKGLRNPRRVRDAPLRISFLTLTIVLYCLFVYIYPTLFAYLNLPFRSSVFLSRVVFLSYLLIVLTTGLLYVLACDPLRPCPGKLREWFRRAAPSRLAASEIAER